MRQGRPRSGEVERSACVLVTVGGGGERPHEVPPVDGERIGAHLNDLRDAGVDEAIIVVDPVNERSIRTLGARIRDLANAP